MDDEARERGVQARMEQAVDLDRLVAENPWYTPHPSVSAITEGMSHEVVQRLLDHDQLPSSNAAAAQVSLRPDLLLRGWLGGRVDASGLPLPSCLLYPGLLHLVIGDYGALKTWFALVATAEAVRRGDRVLIMENDTGQTQIMQRLQAMGLRPSQIEAQVLHMSTAWLGERLARNPLHGPTTVHEWLEHAVVTSRAALVIVDTATAYLAAQSANANQSGDIELAWNVLRRIGFGMARRWTPTGLVRPQEPTRPSVLVLDHPNKADPNGKAGGSGYKQSGVPVVFHLRQRDRLKPGLVGSSQVRLFKDRPGALGVPQGEDAESIVGYLVVDARETTEADPTSPVVASLSERGPAFGHDDPLTQGLADTATRGLDTAAVRGEAHAKVMYEVLIAAPTALPKSQWRSAEALRGSGIDVLERGRLIDSLLEGKYPDLRVDSGHGRVPSGQRALFCWPASQPEKDPGGRS